MIFIVKGITVWGDRLWAPPVEWRRWTATRPQLLTPKVLKSTTRTRCRPGTFLRSIAKGAAPFLQTFMARCVSDFRAVMTSICSHFVPFHGKSNQMALPFPTRFFFHKSRRSKAKELPLATCRSGSLVKKDQVILSRLWKQQNKWIEVMMAEWLL